MMNKLFDSRLDDAYIPYNPPRWINVVAVLSVVTTAMLAILIYFGTLLAILTLLTATLAALAWLKLGYPEPLSRRILPIYILVIIANLLQGAEQHAGHYLVLLESYFPEFVNASGASSDMKFAVVFSFTPVAIYLLVGVTIFYQARIGGFVIWWLFIWSIIFPVSHFLLPFISATGSELLPGKIMAPITIFIAITGLTHIVAQNKVEKGAA